MKYRELAALIATFTEEQLDQDVSVQVSYDGEHFPLHPSRGPVKFSEEDDILDEGHPFLVI